MTDVSYRYCIYSLSNTTHAVGVGTGGLIAWDAAIEDPDSLMASGQFTPDIPGLYRISVTIGVPTTGGVFSLILRKNGSDYLYGQNAGTTAYAGAISLSTLVYLNGSSDYVDCRALGDTSANLYTATTPFNQFAAELVSAG